MQPRTYGFHPSTANMPSAKFTNPKNLDVIPPNQAFTVSLAIQGMQTGNFTNAEQTYFSAPQQLNAQGQIQGHSHIVIEQLDSLTQTTPTDPTKFSFFKGLNAPANNGILTADVTNGLPEGTYKISTINSAANHQPVLVPIAQHGSLDDAVYRPSAVASVTTTATSSAASSTDTSGQGNGSGGNGGGGGGNGGNGGNGGGNGGNGGGNGGGGNGGGGGGGGQGGNGGRGQGGHGGGRGGGGNRRHFLSRNNMH
ncbi:hypothetical protein EV424DRAFT_1381333 [Suillus variegatus]|nr:hypothetical protein EV424DRAFT_1381333 [Suillus variegatus]